MMSYLTFPYKDRVLEGGQSTEEGSTLHYEYDEENKKYEVYESQRKEIFFNEILAQDEIDRLILNLQRLTTSKIFIKGKEKFTTFNRNTDAGVITDSLIIKGNNLIALHCLKEEFAGRIKLIYIDPPFNKGGKGDTFMYTIILKDLPTNFRKKPS